MKALAVALVLALAVPAAAGTIYKYRDAGGGPVFSDHELTTQEMEARGLELYETEAARTPRPADIEPAAPPSTVAPATMEDQPTVEPLNMTGNWWLISQIRESSCKGWTSYSGAISVTHNGKEFVLHVEGDPQRRGTYNPQDRTFEVSFDRDNGIVKRHVTWHGRVINSGSMAGDREIIGGLGCRMKIDFSMVRLP